MQVGEDWSQAGAYKLLENTHAQTLPEELATAKRLGVQPMHVDDPGFGKVANAGLLHWAVTQRGELLVVPQTVGTEHIAPTVLTNGGPVLATGMADIAVDGKRAIGIEISNKSRHFLTDKKSLEIGKQAFQALGITFLLEKDSSGDVDGKDANSRPERHERHDENHGERQNRGGRDGNNGGNGGGHPVAYDGYSSGSDKEDGVNLDNAQALLDKGVGSELINGWLQKGGKLADLQLLLDNGASSDQIETWFTNGDLAPKETVNPDLKRAINKALRSKRLGTRLEGVVARIVEMASYDITEFQKDVYGPIGTVTDIDVGVPGVIVEVKSGKTWDSKATEKLEIKLGEGPDGALVNPDKKPVIVYAPEMPPEKVEWIKNTGERVHVAQNPEQYINLLKLLNRK